MAASFIFIHTYPEVCIAHKAGEKNRINSIFPFLFFFFSATIQHHTDKSCMPFK